MTTPNIAPSLLDPGWPRKANPLPFGVVIERRTDGYDYILPRTGADEPKRRVLP